MPMAAREAIKKLIKSLNHFNRFLKGGIIKKIVSTWQKACSPAQPRTGTESKGGKKGRAHGRAHPYPGCSVGRGLSSWETPGSAGWVLLRATAPGRPHVSHRVPGQAMAGDCRGVSSGLLATV